MSSRSFREAESEPLKGLITEHKIRSLQQTCGSMDRINQKSPCKYFEMYLSTALKWQTTSQNVEFDFFQSLLYLLYRDNSKGKFQCHRKCEWWKYSQSKLILNFTLIFAETIFHCPSTYHHWFACKVLTEMNCWCKLFWNPWFHWIWISCLMHSIIL